jgi:hypothetical protein
MHRKGERLEAKGNEMVDTQEGRAGSRTKIDQTSKRGLQTKNNRKPKEKGSGGDLNPS